MAKSNPNKSFKSFMKANPQPKGISIKNITPNGVKADKQKLNIPPDIFKLPES